MVAAAYGAAEVFAFPSRTDTQALVLQEAALAGLPAVLADPVLHRYGALAGAAVCAGAEPAAFARRPDRPARRPGAGAPDRRSWRAARAAEHTPARYARGRARRVRAGRGWAGPARSARAAMPARVRGWYR